MPIVKDKTTGEVVAELPYDAQGKAKADQMVQASPSLEIDYAPGGASNAMARSTTTYLEGGKVMPYAVAPIISEIPEEEDSAAVSARASAQVQKSKMIRMTKSKGIADFKAAKIKKYEKRFRRYYGSGVDKKAEEWYNKNYDGAGNRR